MKTSLLPVVAAMFVALYLGIRARRGHAMNLEQWTIGGRSFRTAFVFLLMAGEIYTTFTFLGGSGFAYGKGAAVYYILASGTLAYLVSYWTLPAVWRYAKKYKLLTQPEYFAKKYDSRALGVLVAVVGVVALIPYLVLQLKGLGIIVATASYGAIPPSAAVWAGAVVTTIYVILSGVRGSALISGVKDFLVLVVVIVLGIYLPIHFYGGVGSMFHAIDVARPGFLVFPANGMSVIWYESTVLLTCLGFFMWPHTFGSSFTANNERIFRRNAVVLPLYQLVLLFVFFVGFAATLKVPGLKGSDIDLSLFRLSLETFNPWMIGVIGAAGVLTALVPGSVLLTSASTLLANDVYRGAINCDATDALVGKLARCLVPIVALVAVWFTLHGGETIVALLLMGYSFVTQLFPILVASLMQRNPATRQGALWGLAAGVVVVGATTIMKSSVGQMFPFLPDMLKDINIGFVALGVNVIVLAGVSAITRAGLDHK
jgi:SSS family solute:Na+ symporter